MTAAVEGMQAPASAPRVLVVDDEPVLLTLMRRMLTRAGYQVATVETAEAALAWLEAERGSEVVVTDATIDYTEPPIAVVSDVRLPMMNGCALGREIVRRWPDTKLLFISGYIQEDLLARKICPGNLPLLPKPFGPEDFLRAVRVTIACAPWSPNEWPDTPADAHWPGED